MYYRQIFSCKLENILNSKGNFEDSKQKSSIYNCTSVRQMLFCLPIPLALLLKLELPLHLPETSLEFSGKLHPRNQSTAFDTVTLPSCGCVHTAQPRQAAPSPGFHLHCLSSSQLQPVRITKLDTQQQHVKMAEKRTASSQPVVRNTPESQQPTGYLYLY